MKTSKAVRRSPAPSTSKPSKPPVPAQAGPSIWFIVGGLVLAAIIVFIVYGPALGGPFLLDDLALPYAQQAFANAPLSDWLRGVRPLLMLSFWLNFQSSGLDTHGYHVVNVLLHLMCGGLVFLIVRKVLSWARIAPHRIDVFSAFAAALFLLHPLQTEAVAYIASRSEVQSDLFFLAAIALFVYRRSIPITWLVALAILILFGAAVLTKEHAAILPLFLLLTDYFWNPGFSLQGIRRNWKLYVPLAVCAAAAGVFVLRVLSSAVSAGFGLKDLTWYQYFFTECRAIWRYVLFFLFPFGQNIDHDFATSKTIAAHGAFLGLLGLVALAAFAWMWRRRDPLLSYGILILLTLFLPTSSVIPIRDTLVERRMYLPFIGFLFIAIALLNYWKASRSTLVGVLSVVLLIEAGLTYQRNLLWGDAIGIWSDSVAKAPAKSRPRFQLAYALYTAQRCPEAAAAFAQTASLQTPDPSLLVDWALAADCAGSPGEAISKLQQAVALSPTAHIYSQLGMEYAKSGQYPQALDALEKAIQLDPNWEMSYVYRGNVYALQGNRVQAAADFQKALQIDPQNQSARDGLMTLAQRR